MPRIPTARQQVTPSGRPTAATISPSVAETGAGGIGAGVGRIGGALAEIGSVFQEAEDATLLTLVE